MNKIKLPIDLITINTNKIQDGINALNYSSKFFEFNNIFLFTNEKKVKGNFDVIEIDKLKSVEDYNLHILTLNKYITSDFVLVIQHDGHIINPYKWDDSFLKYDYIGAPWPNNKKWNERWAPYPNSQEIIKNLNFNRIGNGGFSLRSKKFLNFSASFKKVELDCPEDIFLNLVKYENAILENIAYPDIETAMKFSYETPLRGKDLKYDRKFGIFFKKNHFGWHGDKFLNSKYVNNLKNS